MSNLLSQLRSTFKIESNISIDKSLSIYIKNLLHIGETTSNLLGALIDHRPILTPEDRPNAILPEILQRKGLLDIFKDINNQQTDYTTHHYVSREVCNGLDEGWDEVDEYYTSYHYTKTFSITLYGEKYYHYWLQRLGKIYQLCFPERTKNLIANFLIL